MFEWNGKGYKLSIIELIGKRYTFDQNLILITLNQTNLQMFKSLNIVDQVEGWLTFLHFKIIFNKSKLYQGSSHIKLILT